MKDILTFLNYEVMCIDCPPPLMFFGQVREDVVMPKITPIEWGLILSLIGVALIVGVKVWKSEEIFKNPPAIQRPAN